jgi:hypothetical protein
MHGVAQSLRVISAASKFLRVRSVLQLYILQETSAYAAVLCSSSLTTMLFVLAFGAFCMIHSFSVTVGSRTFEGLSYPTINPVEGVKMPLPASYVPSGITRLIPVSE